MMWEHCGMERSQEGLLKAIDLIRGLREEFRRNVRVLGAADTLNQSLDKAGRVADFLEPGELMCIDALHRRESCGGHFRAESQTEDGEALRNDDEFLYVAAWEFEAGTGTARWVPRSCTRRTSSTKPSNSSSGLQVSTPEGLTLSAAPRERATVSDTSRGPRS